MSSLFRLVIEALGEVKFLTGTVSAQRIVLPVHVAIPQDQSETDLLLEVYSSVDNGNFSYELTRSGDVPTPPWST